VIVIVIVRQSGIVERREELVNYFPKYFCRLSAVRKVSTMLLLPVYALLEDTER